MERRGTKLFRLSLGLFAGSCEAVLGLHGRKLRLLLVRVQLLEGLVGLVVEDDEVPVADVEAAEVVASVLRVEDVLVHDEGGAAGLGCVAPEQKNNTIIAPIGLEALSSRMKDTTNTICSCTSIINSNEKLFS